MTTSAALFNPQTPPGLVMPQTAPLGSAGGSGAISGGALRPGSVDQATFVQMLQQQQQNRQAAGVGGKPVQMPIQNFQPAIPTLTSAQFAALVGSQAEPAAEPAEGPATDPAAQVQAAARVGVPVAPALRLSGAPNRNATGQAGNRPAPEEDAEDMPTISRASDAQQLAAATAAPSAEDEIEITRKSAPSAASAAPDGDGKTATESETASKSDPNVVHLKNPPDKEQQKELRMQHKRWVVDETPGARQLFFGADGKFGWDDFLDIINPLQHIPGIAQIYRAVTGDEINGAASLLGAIPYGPFSGLGMIATIADLAIKDTTGKDMGENLIAMVFGKDETPADGAGTAPADMAQAGESGSTTVQTATRETRYALSDASTLHEACRG